MLIKSCRITQGVALIRVFLLHISMKGGANFWCADIIFFSVYNDSDFAQKSFRQRERRAVPIGWMFSII